MEVILRERVEKLGNRGDVVKVSDGFARNFLLPHKLALPSTPANRKQVDQEKTVAVRREAHEKTEAEALAQQLSKVAIRLARKVGEHGVLYGSVTALDIAEAFSAQGFTVDRRKIEMEEAIKSLGQHTVSIKLHREVAASITVEVIKEE